MDQPETWLFNGPYVLKEWKEEQYIRLDPNKTYIEKTHSNLPVEVRLVEDGTAALNLFQANRLDFVPMIPTSQIPEWKKHAEFFETSIPRFDFIGFGPAFESLPSLREAISLSSDFKGFQKLFQSKARPGCPGFPSKWTGGPVCLNDDVKRAKQIIEKSKESPPKPLTYYFTKIPTDDLVRGAEFYQQAWKRNLDLDVVLQSREIGVYRALLRESPPPLFRRGVALDRPSCLALWRCLNRIIWTTPFAFKIRLTTT
jgi:oligopeptide transport system substrate-binding protein